MKRSLVVGAAQLGPSDESQSRADVVSRMIALLDEAAGRGCDIVAFPELALTPYFPKVIAHDYDRYFETEMPNSDVQPLFDRAAEHGLSFTFGYAERTAGGRRFNAAVYVDARGEVLSKYRKIHLPGLPDGRGSALVYEPHYFETGEDGFEVVSDDGVNVGLALCQDRRYPETYRVLALAGADIVFLGYNTPVLPLSHSQHELCIRSGAYHNGVYVVAVAKAGVEEGVRLLAGTAIVDPHGEVVARSSSESDELVVARLRPEEMSRSRGHWNFFARRQPQHYRSITEPVVDRTFVHVPPPA